jgi:hypothetical protein
VKRTKYIPVLRYSGPALMAALVKVMLKPQSGPVVIRAGRLEFDCVVIQVAPTKSSCAEIQITLAPSGAPRKAIK